MLATAIIVFREVIEAALVIGIVMAASQGAAFRNLWITGGVAAGLIGSCVVAAFAGTLAEAAAGFGQELFNAAILFTAVIMLGWHNVWMRRHGREIARDMNRVGRAVASGERPLYALAIVVGMAVLREGSEVVLFLYGIASTESGGGSAMISGGVLGIVLGAAIGAGMYRGLLRIPAQHLFTVTSGLILLLAAGLASQGAACLVQADWLPAFGHEVWNSSALLSEDSLPGQVLHTLIGYVSRPDGIQILFYLGTLVAISLLMRLFGDDDKTVSS
ncbi:iron permease [Candidatus Methylospira mobilis]|uniref:Iron permease n=2 Tax=Candidatus Methylospira mobilis TaxID=1808979 RepID=A0A5Q0BCQ2_9GAMM|nr:FTR1 family protein [Candidatus Methylospira mobilis]QFY41645.1 iron permease [Candidatus Methylospira mobilis]WNV05103.1 FTR1 family protein [Candidatus Methylospira mobilis]